jgi:hypothetical protein
VRPVLVPIVRQELARIEVHRLAQRLGCARPCRARGRLLELVDIDPDGRCSERDHGAVGLKQRCGARVSSRLESPTSGVERGTEVVRRSGRVEVGPEDVDQLVTMEPVLR